MEFTRLKIGSSACVGSILLVMADIGLKGQTSAIKTIRDNLTSFFSFDLQYLWIVATFTIAALILIAIACCFIFEEKSTKQAFFRGASVLAIAMTMIPNPQYAIAPTEKQSELVQVKITTDDGHPITRATLTIWDVGRNKIVATARFSSNSHSFYQTAGRYRLDIESPGYSIESREFEVIDQKLVSPVSVTLTKATVPLFLQRVFR